MDEPTTALDVVMHREIVRQIVQLRDQFGFAVIFITHDMSLLLEIADRIAIMYAGKIIEDGGSQEDVGRTLARLRLDNVIHHLKALRSALHVLS